jgi:hypothetical protein
MATKNAHWQAAFRRRMREAGLKAVTVWMPKEGADRLARYPEKERGEVVTRALALLESQVEFTGNDATLTGERLTDESRDKGEAREDTLTVAELFTRLKRVEAILSTITSNSTGVLTGNEPPGPQATLTGESTDKSTGKGAVALSETPPPPVPEPPVKLPLKRIPALIRRAKRLSAQGVSWKEIARRFNAEGIPTLSGIGKWYGSTVQHMIEKHGQEENP